jgi:hypothetical protein
VVFRGTTAVALMGGTLTERTVTISAVASQLAVIQPSAQILQFPPVGGAPPAANPKGPLGMPLHGPFAGPIGL